MRSEFKRMMPALFLMGKLTPNSGLTPSAIGDTSAIAAGGDLDEKWPVLITDRPLVF